MKHLGRALLPLVAVAALAGAVVASVSAAGVSPDQLAKAGWTCVQPLADPTREICAPPSQGLPLLPNTPGFADRGPSYELLVFQFATGEFIGVQHLRPDIYLNGASERRVRLHPTQRHVELLQGQVEKEGRPPALGLGGGAGGRSLRATGSCHKSGRRTDVPTSASALNSFALAE